MGWHQAVSGCVTQRGELFVCRCESSWRHGMDRQSSNELTVLSIVPRNGECAVELQDGVERGQFTLRFEQEGSIRILCGADDLTRWLTNVGKLWALSRI